MSEDAKPEPAKGLLVLTEKELIEGDKYQRDHYDWDLTKEREFVENLFCQRFNFLLIIYSLFVTAAASTSTQTNLVIVLGLGTVLTFLLSLTQYRVWVKLDLNLTMLYRLPKHPFEFLDVETKARKWRGLFPVNSVIGIWIPAFCTLSLAVGTYLACVGIITVEATAPLTSSP